MRGEVAPAGGEDRALRLWNGTWATLLVAGVALLASSTARAAADGVTSAATLPREYGVRWEEPASTADGIARWLDASLEPVEGYAVEFWQREHDAAGNSFFMRLRKMRTDPAWFQILKKVRVGDACTYRCSDADGHETREVDETFSSNAAGDGFIVHGICSTSCARESATRPADVAASAPCPGGPAEVRRWRVLRGKKHLHLERWSRGDRVLWDLSARSEHVSAKAFAKAASLLLTHHVKPLAQSKHDWMCGDR